MDTVIAKFFIVVFQVSTKGVDPAIADTSWLFCPQTTLVTTFTLIMDPTLEMLILLGTIKYGIVNVSSQVKSNASWSLIVWELLSPV